MDYKFKVRLGLDLETKILLTQQRIREYYYNFGGNVYISFSGGKDSTVIVDIARKLFPKIKCVFINTGNEFPEILKFVKKFDNVDWIKPNMTMKQVIEKYGFPVISKEQSQYIRQYKTAKSEKTKKTRLLGNKWGQGKISKKYIPLLKYDIKISEQCCDILKKNPIKKYEKQTGLHPIIGIRWDEGGMRTSTGTICNILDSKRPVSRPIYFWKSKDVDDYIKINNIEIAEIYNNVDRTGCMMCGFGICAGKSGLDNIRELKPKIYKYAMETLGFKSIIEILLKENIIKLRDKYEEAIKEILEDKK